MPIGNDTDTELQLFTMGVPRYSSRAVKQTLTPIGSINGNRQNLRRDLNGNLQDITPPEFLKYSMRVTGTDQRPPAFDGVWPGTEVTVYCIAYLSYATGGTAQRTEVPHSSFEEDGFVFYRPALVCRLVSFQTEQDEWDQSKNHWEMELEEI